MVYQQAQQPWLGRPAARAERAEGNVRARPVLPLLAVVALGVALVVRSGLLLQRHGSADVFPVGFMGSKRSTAAQTARQNFPGAMKGAWVRTRILEAVEPYGLSWSNTIFGQSLCSDEINSDKGHLSMLLGKYYGKVFHLGGIGGAPYVGKTGFGAFSHHVPENGHVLVLFGPHIGISPTGELGKFLREGQSALSTSCGAVIAAFGQCTSGANMPPDPKDIMQSWLREKIQPFCADVAKSVNPMKDLVMTAYKAVEDEVLKIVNTDFGSGHLVLVGGIQINMPHAMDGFFMPIHFSIRSAGHEPVDLMSAFDQH